MQAGTMWDLKNIINQCVKCESKFTSPEKPLKLLPCLHSMCLDCLYGRTPARRTSTSYCTKNGNEPNTASDKAKLGSCQGGDENASKIFDDDANVKQVDTSVKDCDADSKGCDKDEKLLSISIEFAKHSVDSDRDSKDGVPSQTKDETLEEAETEAGNRIKNEQQKETGDIKPKPVTGKCL